MCRANKHMRVPSLQALQPDGLASGRVTCKSNAPPLYRTWHVCDWEQCTG